MMSSAVTRTVTTPADESRDLFIPNGGVPSLVPLFTKTIWRRRSRKTGFKTRAAHRQSQARSQVTALSRYRWTAQPTVANVSPLNAGACRNGDQRPDHGDTHVGSHDRRAGPRPEVMRKQWRMIVAVGSIVSSSVTGSRLRVPENGVIVSRGIWAAVYRI